jgi:hypothetical protein
MVTTFLEGVEPSMANAYIGRKVLWRSSEMMVTSMAAGYFGSAAFVFRHCLMLT